MSRRKSLSTLLDAVVARSSLVSAVLILAGTLGLVAVPLLERNISFDENALLAGSTSPTIRSKSPIAYQLGKEFASSFHSSTFSPAFTEQLQQQIRQQLGLQVSNHTFVVSRQTTSSSIRGSSDSGGKHQARSNELNCTNVHTVLESRRGDGKEALVLVTPINHQQYATDFDQDASGVQLALALGFAMLYHLKTAALWLAKDVVWVIPDASCGLVESMQAWTDAYQHPERLPAYEDASKPLAPFTRAGVLQQALVLELPTGNFNQLQISLEGYDGLLPKLDMYWLFRWYSWHYVGAPIELPHLGDIQQRLRPAIDTLLNTLLPSGGSDSAVGKAIQQHVFKFTTMAQFMWRQARGLPMGAHAPFKGLMVDAATLRVLRKDAGGRAVSSDGFSAVGNERKASVDPGNQSSQLAARVLTFDEGLMQLGDVLELTLRSCSVLIERFHHSLFLYVLTGLDHYVSVERYIGPLVALIVVVVLQAAAINQGPVGLASDTPPASEQAIRTINTSAPPSKQQKEQQDDEHKEGLSTDEDLPLEDPLQLRPPEAAAVAAAERGDWISAVGLVAATHLGAVAAACALRHTPAIVLLLQRPQILTGWLAEAAAAPDEHLQQMGLGFGMLVALILVLENLSGSMPAKGSTSSSSSSSADSDASAALIDQIHSSLVKKVRVVEFNIAAAALAAIACLNWAMGYVACLVLVPLACATSAATGNNTSGSWQAQLRLWIPCLCSPLGLLLMFAAVSGDGVWSILQLQWWQWLALGSSSSAYMFCWGVYLPFWCLVAWSLYVLRR